MIDIQVQPVKRAFAKAIPAIASILLIGCATPAVFAATEDPSDVQQPPIIDHASEFTALHSLVGNWLGKDTRGNEIEVIYRLTAGDSVLVETWNFSNGRQSLTLYHMDGDRMIATHYCPIGNQPRLALQSKTEGGVLEFEFFDATNLPDPSQSHEHAFDMQIIDSDTFVRNETYISNGETDSNGIRFIRQ